MQEPIDQLSWTEFLKNSQERRGPLRTVEKYNRLIIHSKNFFVISGYGAFTPGYMLIVTKKLIPSYGLIESEQKNELDFLILQLQNLIKNNFKRKSVVFEHGMCACVGGLDRAHLHVMSISSKTNDVSLKKAINETLYSRKAGIEHILYNNYKLENLHDINQIYETIEKNNSTANIEVVGKIYKLNNIKNLDEKKWPLITMDHIMKGGHYVYFKSDYSNASFLTTNNFQTQFGREVVFNNENNLDSNFSSKFNIDNSDHLWKWQNLMCEENILETIKIAKNGFKELKANNIKKYERYNIKVS
jgi:diadenosine tetraphosphate (Ap4A) HIT family hydrolase